MRTAFDRVLGSEACYDEGRFEMITASQEPDDVKVANGPDVRFMYLAVLATEDGAVNFRPDIYGLGGTGFILGQPEPRTN